MATDAHARIGRMVQVPRLVPGRELRETLSSGILTTFLIEPGGQDQATVTITTEYTKPGVSGWFEKQLATWYLRRVYVAELAQLARVAEGRC